MVIVALYTLSVERFQSADYQEDYSLCDTNFLTGVMHMYSSPPPHHLRVSSGAQIKIAGNEGETQDRLVTITGTPEAVGMAQYLINSR